MSKASAYTRDRKFITIWDGKYTTFASTIGIDAETNLKGSVVFQVWADGEKIYDSGTVHAEDGAQKISVDVTGKKDLALVVTNAGDNNDSDHADWAGSAAADHDAARAGADARAESRNQ